MIDGAATLINSEMSELVGFAMSHPVQLPCFFVALFIFHISEFLLALLIHGSEKVSTSSFLFSKEYILAMTCGLLEYGMEAFYVPSLKSKMHISFIGLTLLCVGEAIRKTAILTAKQNFTHDIKIYHHENHELVTHGVYRFVRHPSYLGFFIWSAGTQVLLVNPICTVGYMIVTWRYFAQRISFEEYFLRQFFGKQYIDYARRVHSGIPFVK
ncbi:hypothetical protein KP509_29G016000 [Ceratopteris richardii]|uniref:Protein-S-isoprenylcysteine O-methyltransferase n=1 Tax=Ceratopteris richardii TaxID=49495 RepID=A0A8T2R6R5_CERRI|nr:hypothetical protein KP509_29G016000 [Ceratopteris richardii]